MSTLQAAMVEAVRSIIKPGRRWVLFEHGTVVVVDDESVDDPTALAMLKVASDEGEAPGTAAGDFAVEAVEGRGWVVGSHDPDIFTFVPATEVTPGSSDVVVGLAARTARGADADGQNVLVVGP